MLSAQQLCRLVDGEAIVDTVDFEVEPGDVFVIFGPSGAGKSSLLRLLNRLDEPSSGTVRLRGQDYRDIPPQRLRKQVGMVPQQPTLIDGTVAENVSWGPRLRGEPVGRERVNDLLDRLGLSGFADREAGDLSGGEAQRVAIARTLYNEPDIVLLDEPASSLDADAARQVETLLSDVMRDLSITAILVTHDTERARRLGSRGIRMEDGRVARRGSIEDILDA
jgi:putative ABC transport system ATP-binding protein